MSSLDKIILAATVLLAVAVVVVLTMPDTIGQIGFQSLSPVMGEASAFFERTLASSEHQLAAWMDTMQAWVGQMSPQPSSNIGQGNPVDNAVKPVGSYGEEQKDELGKPLEGLQP